MGEFELTKKQINIMVLVGLPHTVVVAIAGWILAESNVLLWFVYAFLGEAIYILYYLALRHLLITGTEINHYLAFSVGILFFYCLVGALVYNFATAS